MAVALRCSKPAMLVGVLLLLGYAAAQGSGDDGPQNISQLADFDVSNLREFVRCVKWSTFAALVVPSGAEIDPTKAHAQAGGNSLSLYTNPKLQDYKQWCGVINAAKLTSGAESRFVPLSNNRGVGMVVNFWAKPNARFVSQATAEAELIAVANLCAKRNTPLDDAKAWSECIVNIAVEPESRPNRKIMAVAVVTPSAANGAVARPDRGLPLIQKTLTLTSGGRTGSLLFVTIPASY